MVAVALTGSFQTAQYHLLLVLSLLPIGLQRWLHILPLQSSRFPQFLPTTECPICANAGIVWLFCFPPSWGVSLDQYPSSTLAWQERHHDVNWLQAVLLSSLLQPKVPSGDSIIWESDKYLTWYLFVLFLNYFSFYMIPIFTLTFGWWSLTSELFFIHPGCLLCYLPINSNKKFFICCRLCFTC